MANEPAEARQPPTAPQNDDEVSILDLAVVMAENARLLVVGPLFVGLLTLGVSFLVSPTFTGRTSFLPPQQQHSASAAMLAQLGNLAGLAASAAGIKNPADQYVALLKSTTVADRLIEKFDLVSLYDVDFRQDARKALANNTQIATGRDGLIVVEVDDKSPQRAADMANSYVAELEAMIGRLALTEAQQRRVFFEKQLEVTRKSLADAEIALTASGVTPSTMKANPDAAVEAVARLQALVTAQEVKLAAMRGYLTESAPEFKQAQTELTALRSQLLRQGLPASELSKPGEYIDRYRNFKYYETLFELFARQFELAKVDEAREGAVIQVVDQALPPERKSKPKRAMLAIVTTLAAGILLVLFVFIRRAVQTANRDSNGAVKLAALRLGLQRALKR